MESTTTSSGLCEPSVAEVDTTLLQDTGSESSSTDRVEDWLRSLGPCLESVNDSIFNVLRDATSIAGPLESATQTHFWNARDLDSEAVTKLRLDRWNHEFFSKNVEREREEVQNTMEELETKFLREQDRARVLEAELKEVKKELDVQTRLAKEVENLRSEVNAFKVIAMIEWTPDSKSQLRPKRNAPVDVDLAEPPRKRFASVLRDTGAASAPL